MRQPPGGDYHGQQPEGRPSRSSDSPRRPLPPPAVPTQWQRDAPPQAYEPSAAPPGSRPPGYAQPGYPPQSPQPSYAPHGQRSGPAPGSRSPQIPRPQRAHRKRLRKRDAILIAIAGILVIGVISSALGSGGKSGKSVAAASSASAVKASAMIAQAENACYKRPPASGDIYVRMVTPGVSPQAQQLGGEWDWDHTTNKCLTSVQMMIATAPRSAGNCTQVGYVDDNPGYDVNAAVAPPLTHVAAQAGPACQTGASSAAAPTTPAAAPPASAQTAPAAVAPSAAATPASCSPLSDEGTCYKPGEYCRADDHGMSGVAGDGEPISCEDNDGWRWEPA